MDGINKSERVKIQRMINSIAGDHPEWDDEEVCDWLIHSMESRAALAEKEAAAWQELCGRWIEWGLKNAVHDGGYVGPDYEPMPPEKPEGVCNMKTIKYANREIGTTLLMVQSELEHNASEIMKLRAELDAYKELLGRWIKWVYNHASKQSIKYQKLPPEKPEGM